jgi:hypothetical protein
MDKRLNLCPRCKKHEGRIKTHSWKLNNNSKAKISFYVTCLGCPEKTAYWLKEEEAIHAWNSGTLLEAISKTD